MMASKWYTQQGHAEEGRKETPIYDYYGISERQKWARWHLTDLTHTVFIVSLIASIWAPNYKQYYDAFELLRKCQMYVRAPQLWRFHDDSRWRCLVGRCEVRMKIEWKKETEKDVRARDNSTDHKFIKYLHIFYCGSGSWIMRMCSSILGDKNDNL